MILYKDYDSLFEKFSILTIDGKMEDSDAIYFLANKTTSELLHQLINFLQNK